tara:strand:+ start:578 stop:727 length:150 start_codon:yes stop_codon:yes gene_type:complete
MNQNNIDDFVAQARISSSSGVFGDIIGSLYFLGLGAIYLTVGLALLGFL